MNLEEETVRNLLEEARNKLAEAYKLCDDELQNMLMPHIEDIDRIKIGLRQGEHYEPA
jgi:hypothetical protein